MFNCNLKKCFFLAESSKLDSTVFKENTANCEQNVNSETLETDLTSNNLNEPFFIDISKLKGMVLV